MGPDSAIGSYFVDLMHDRNAAIREMCDNALLILGVSIPYSPIHIPIGKFTRLGSKNSCSSISVAQRAMVEYD